jgi:hypothetical protein
MMTLADSAQDGLEDLKGIRLAPAGSEASYPLAVRRERPL